MKKTLLYLSLFALSMHGLAQHYSDPAKFPQITPPSPDAAALGRYGEFPVSLATGTPEISVPLYEIKSGKISVPISVSYHASGVRVNDIASRIGLGWSLMAGGMVTRVIKGQPDDATTIGYFTEGVPSESSSGDSYNCFLNRLAYGHNQADGQPDDFFYSFNRRSGKIVFSNPRTTTNGPFPITIPFSNLKIVFSGLDQIQLTDEEGTLYVFGKSLSGNQAKETSYPTTGSNPSYVLTSVLSSWYLTDIVSSDKADTIRFFYTSPQYVFHEKHVVTSLIDDISSLGGTPHMCSHSYTTSGNDIQQIRLTEIFFRNGKVKIDYSASSRLDVANDTCVSGITVFQNVNNSYTQMKQFRFYQSYFSCANVAPPPAVWGDQDPGDQSKRLRLDSIKEVGKDGALLPGYLFDYTNTQLPYVGSNAQDLLGFYNGASTNTNMLIYDVNGNLNSEPSAAYGANRSVNASYATAGMISKITFPTGGYSRFVFESNQYNSTLVGGLRIKRIVSVDNAGSMITKSYNYYNPVLISNMYSTSVDAMALLFKFQYTESVNDEYNPTRTYNNYYENFSFPLGSSSGSAVTYGRVEELYDSLGGINGKKEYTYTTSQDETAANMPQNTVTYEWRRGLVLTEKVYKSSGTGTFVLLASKRNIYTYNDRPALMVRTISVRPWFSYQNCGCSVNLIPNCSQFVAGNLVNLSYGFMLVGNDYLTRKIDTTYDLNGLNPVIDTVNYFYDDSISVNPTRVETRNSKGQLVKTISRTALEKSDMNNTLALSASASIAIDTMLARNMVSPALDREKYIDGQLISRSRTNYMVFSPNLIEPATIQVQNGSNPIETRVQFDSYDPYGNINSGGMTTDQKLSYLWDYRGVYPIAEVKNATIDQVAYTSFEADGTGNWTINSSSRDNTAAITGTRCYMLNSDVSKSSLNTATTYIVSYWTKNAGAFSIAGTVAGYPIQGKTINGWTFYIHKVTGQSTITINGTGRIDELRLYPITALMTSYTYQPLVGITSQSDASGKITSYEYDGFLRLLRIKDMDGNIIKQFGYQYQAAYNQ